MKLCVTLIVKAETEFIASLDSLWANGEKKDPKSLQYYRRYITKYELKTFRYVFSYSWVDKQYWYRDLRTLPLDFYMLFIRAINSKRHTLLEVFFLVLNKTMWG